MLFDAQTQAGGSIDMTLILAILTGLGIVTGPAIAYIFKTLKSILKEIYDLKAWMTEYQPAKTDLEAQTAKLEECIHKVPGHPEKPVNS